MGAMAMGGAPAPRMNSNDTPTPYAWNPQTKQLLAGGTVVPKDISAYQQGLAHPTQLAPMSSSQLSEHGFIPLTHDQLTQFVNTVQSQATAPVLHNAWEGVKEGASSFMEGIDRLGASALGRQLFAPSAVTEWQDGKPNGLGQIVEQGSRARIDERAADMALDRTDARQALTLQQQAGQDAKFTEHPGSFVAGRLGSFAGAAGPLIAATAVNPTLGGAMVVGQSAGGSA